VAGQARPRAQKKIETSPRGRFFLVSLFLLLFGFSGDGRLDLEAGFFFGTIDAAPSRPSSILELFKEGSETCSKLKPKQKEKQALRAFPPPS
jgi:hypothetical protein